VYFTEHRPFFNVQVVVVNVPGSLLDHVSMPVGEYPETLAVHL